MVSQSVTRSQNTIFQLQKSLFGELEKKEKQKEKCTSKSKKRTNRPTPVNTIHACVISGSMIHFNNNCNCNCTKRKWNEMKIVQVAWDTCHMANDRSTDTNLHLIGCSRTYLFCFAFLSPNRTCNLFGSWDLLLCVVVCLACCANKVLTHRIEYKNIQSWNHNFFCSSISFLFVEVFISQCATRKCSDDNKRSSYCSITIDYYRR